MTKSGFIVAACLTVVCLSTSTLRAQPAFEVATVKSNHSAVPPRNYPNLRNGRFTAENASLKTLLVVAFGLIEQRIDGPDWLAAEKYDILAKAPEGVPDTELKPLLQALLKDRFRLETHFENKEMPVYEMVAGKGGPKLTLFDPAHPPSPPRTRERAWSSMVGVGTTAQIADGLAHEAGRPVVDKVGLEGRFGWMINFNPPSAGPGADPSAPDFFGAVEQQLGLKLVPKKEALPVLIVDHAERSPSEN